MEKKSSKRFSSRSGSRQLSLTLDEPLEADSVRGAEASLDIGETTLRAGGIAINISFDYILLPKLFRIILNSYLRCRRLDVKIFGNCGRTNIGRRFGQSSNTGQRLQRPGDFVQAQNNWSAVCSQGKLVEVD